MATRLTPAQRFRQSVAPWAGAFRVTLTEPQVDALLALDKRDGGTDPGPTRSRGTWNALEAMGMIRTPDPSRRAEWAEIEVTEIGATVLTLMRLAGYE